MIKKVLVPLAEGFEELEAVSIIDTLRRAGIDVTVASLKDTPLVKGSHNISIQADCTLDSKKDVANFDAFVLPGGWDGMLNLKSDKRVIEICKYMCENNLLVAAICAAPIALGESAILKDKKFTCYPGCESQVKDGEYQKESIVVVDKNIITSKGPATAVIFALEIVKYLLGEAKQKEVKESMLVHLLTDK